MATGSNLRPGHTYYLVSFEDETFARPLIDTCEFLGKDIEGTPSDPSSHDYYFRMVDSEGDQVIFTEAQIWQVLNIDDLIEKLTDFRNGKIE
jgi:hypothetical protein